MGGMDETIIALYARGLSTRGIQKELAGLYGAEVSPTLISNVTHSVLEEVQAWQTRALDPVYPILYFDGLFVKSRQDGSIRNKAVSLTLGINLEVEKELLGMWLGETEGAQVLAGRVQRAEDPRSTGLLHRLCGWTQGIAGSHQDRVSAYPGSIVYRASGPQQLEVCHLERSQAGSR